MISTSHQHRPPELKRVLVIGVGNTLRGDDAIGHTVAAALEPYVAQTGIDVVTVHQLLPELALTLRQARLLIVVDAAVDVAPGRVVGKLERPAGGLRTVGHFETLQNVLDIARRVFHHAPETWTVSIGGARWDVGASLSPAVDAAIPKALHRIEYIIAARCPAFLLHAPRPLREPVTRS